jgi:16S rRNA processing protein RimM
LAPEKLIALGQIVNVHATHGELRVHLFNPSSTVLTGGSDIVLQRGGEEQRRRIVAARPHKNLMLVRLEGCESMTAAQALIGYEVCVREADLPPTGADEIYHYQLVGMTVVTTAGAEIGVVSDVLVTPGNDVCVVRADAGEHLIPLIADVVKHIDRERRRLVIDPLPGLLDR